MCNSLIISILIINSFLVLRNNQQSLQIYLCRQYNIIFIIFVAFDIFINIIFYLLYLFYYLNVLYIFY